MYHQWSDVARQQCTYISKKTSFRSHADDSPTRFQCFSNVMCHQWSNVARQRCTYISKKNQNADIKCPTRSQCSTCVGLLLGGLIPIYFYVNKSISYTWYVNKSISYTWYVNKSISYTWYVNKSISYTKILSFLIKLRRITLKR